MASAVDSRLAYARLSAVATASRLPTANRGSNNSYTTSWDTTGVGQFQDGFIHKVLAQPVECRVLDTASRQRQLVDISSTARSFPSNRSDDVHEGIAAIFASEIPAARAPLQCWEYMNLHPLTAR